MVLTQLEIRMRVRQLAEMITHKFRQSNSDKTPIYFLCVMNGAFMFFSDLIREIQLDVRTKFIYAKSYAGTKQQDLSLMYEELDFAELEGQHVVIVEDIVDTGGTILGVIEAVQRFNPKKVELCTLLLRNPKSIISIDHYVGFLLDNEEFIIGYGLDLDSKFRNVAFITTIDEIKAAPYSYLHKYI